MSTESLLLPPKLIRPLYWAAGAILGFLSLFCAWAIFAPLATTLHLSGQFVSSRPSFDLQHPYGGQIEEVLVSKHSTVEKGDLVIRLESALDREQQSSMIETRTVLVDENEVIQRILAGQDVDGNQISGPGAAFAIRENQARLQKLLKVRQADGLALQANALRVKIEHAAAQLRLMQDRSGRQKKLMDQRLIKRSEIETLEEQILIVMSEIEGDRASLISLESQTLQARREAELIQLSLREELESARAANTRQIQELNQRIAQLQDRVKKSNVYAPISGVVTEIYFEADGMFAARGATLVSLAQPLDQPHLSFRVPVGQIDQLRPGMTGRLTIPSLPQRQMPRIDVTVQAISPRADTDEQGNPTTYSGLATIDPGDFQQLHDTLNVVELSEDMPATLMIEARSTTLARYVVAPFVSTFQRALQD